MMVEMDGPGGRLTLIRPQSILNKGTTVRDGVSGGSVINGAACCRDREGLAKKEKEKRTALVI